MADSLPVFRVRIFHTRRKADQHCDVVYFAIDPAVCHSGRRETQAVPLAQFNHYTGIAYRCNTNGRELLHYLLPRCRLFSYLFRLYVLAKTVTKNDAGDSVGPRCAFSDPARVSLWGYCIDPADSLYADSVTLQNCTFVFTHRLRMVSCAWHLPLRCHARNTVASHSWTLRSYTVIIRSHWPEVLFGRPVTVLATLDFGAYRRDTSSRSGSIRKSCHLRSKFLIDAGITDTCGMGLQLAHAVE